MQLITNPDGLRVICVGIGLFRHLRVDVKLTQTGLIAVADAFSFPLDFHFHLHHLALAIGLELRNHSAGMPLAPSIASDMDGCQAGMNAVAVIPDGWSDACTLGVAGDWVIRAFVECSAEGNALLPRGTAGTADPLVAHLTPAADAPATAPLGLERE